MWLCVCGCGRDCERFICNYCICFDVTISLVQDTQHVIINNCKINITNNKHVLKWYH